MSLATRVVDLWDAIKNFVESSLTQVDPSMLPNLTVADLLKLVEAKVASYLGLSSNSLVLSLILKYLEPYLAGLIQMMLRKLQAQNGMVGCCKPE